VRDVKRPSKRLRTEGRTPIAFIGNYKETFPSESVRQQA
jgi:hypothetical protein